MNILKIFDIPAICSEKAIEPTNTFLQGSRVFGVDTKVLLLMVLMSLPSLAVAKYDPATRNLLMQKADKEYRLGNYDVARKIYSDIYVEDGDIASKELMNKCRQCLTLISDATMSERNGQYWDAIEGYQAVMDLNPRDPKVPRLLDESKILAEAFSAYYSCYYNKALTLFSKVNDNPTAQVGLGSIYQFYIGNYTEAVGWYRKAAEQGIAEAQFMLGVMYEHGQGVSKDYYEAVKWYRKSTEQGYRSAQDRLKKLGESYSSYN